MSTQTNSEKKLKNCLQNKFSPRLAELKKWVAELWNKRNKPAGNDKAMWFINFKLEALMKFLDKQAEKEAETNK